MSKANKGFTLTELLVVVLIASILVGLGLPGYRSFVIRGGRTDATTALMKLAASQEKFYLQNGIYASNAQLAALPPAGLGFVGSKSEHGYYNPGDRPRAGGPGRRLYGICSGRGGWQTGRRQ